MSQSNLMIYDTTALQVLQGVLLFCALYLYSEVQRMHSSVARITFTGISALALMLCFNI